MGGSSGVRRGQGGQDSGTLGAAAVLEGQHVEELPQGDRVHGRALEGGLPSHIKRCGGGETRGQHAWREIAPAWNGTDFDQSTLGCGVGHRCFVSCETRN